MCCFKIYLVSFSDNLQEMQLISCLHISAIFHAGTRRFHVGLGPIVPYVAMPPLSTYIIK